MNDAKNLLLSFLITRTSRRGDSVKATTSVL